MPRLITISRAARLVGVKRGVLQKKIREGELRAFEGEILLSDLLHTYPQAEVEDTSMLERVQQIMEQAVNGIVRPPESKPSIDALAARVLALSEDRAQARQEARRLAGVISGLQAQFDVLSRTEPLPDNAIAALKTWFEQALADAQETESDEFIVKEAFLRAMAAQVSTVPGGHEFFVEGVDSILEAGLRSGLALNYGCSNGTCGLCKAKVVSGQVKKIRPHEYVLTEAEKNLDYMLTCCNTAVTDVVIEADEALNTYEIPIQEISVRVKKIQRPDDQIIVLDARTPRTRRLRFLAGQYVTLSFDGLVAQDCSIASCPCDDMNLQFHIPVTTGNAFTEHLAGAARTKDTMIVTGPRGDFTLNENSPRSLLFIACNAGFGPVKSLIEHAMALDIAEDIYLYWITTPGNDHYLGNLCRSWDDALDNFHYHALRADDENTVEKLLPSITAAFGALGNHDCYACVPAEKIATIETILRTWGLPANQLRVEPVR